ncbi:MAG: substrate-binding domain-containing protein [Clostridiaceae bacterium]
MKKLLVMGLISTMIAGSLIGCSTKSESSTSDASTSKKKQIVVISKSFQNQFYQAAFKGANDAGAEFDVEVTTNGPDAESNIPQQVDQVAAAINKKPDAIVLAACDPASLAETLKKAKEANIPVIGFDSGVPGDTSGAVVATAATDNTNAGGVVAKNLFEDKTFQEKVLKGTAENPTIIGILAQDATSGSIVLRTNGFIKEMVSDLETLDGLKGAVEVTGQEIWNKASSSPAKVKISITVPPSTSQADIQTAATTMLKTPNMVALFAANQGAVDGIISATADGTELDKVNGKYKDLMVVGFDSGKAQRQAIKSGAFFGSVTQDPYAMGYDAIRLAVDAINGKTVADVDTGGKWYNSKNVDSEEIAKLLYD